MTIIDDSWLSAVEVARALGISKVHVHRLDAVLEPVRDRHNARRYRPGRVAEVAAERAQRAAQRATRKSTAPTTEPSAVAPGEDATNRP